jgi:PAS domain S-box-containing protein/putative nucleotidyltransferase with HDIG domain
MTDIDHVYTSNAGDAQSSPIFVRVYGGTESEAEDLSALLAGECESGLNLEWGGPIGPAVASLTPGGVDLLLFSFSENTAANALQWLRNLRNAGALLPIMVLVDTAEPEVGLEAFRAGAADVLLRATLTGRYLAHSIRRSIARHFKQSVLDETQRAFRTLLGNVPGAFYRCQNDSVWTFEYLSDGIEQITGYRVNDLPCRLVSYMDLIPVEERPEVAATIQQSLDRCVPFEMQHRVTTRAGEEKWVWTRGRGVYSAEQALTAIEGYLTDVTHRKEAEAGPQNPEEKFKTVFEQALDAILILNADTGDILEANKAVEPLLGHTPETLRGKHFRVLFPEDSQITRAELLENLQTRGAVFESHWLLRSDGALCPMDITASIVSWKNEKVILLTLRDVSERRKAEDDARINRDRLQAMQQQYQAVLRSTPHGLCMITPTWVIDLANRSMCAIAGSAAETPRKLHKMPFQNLFPSTEAFARFRDEAVRAIRMSGIAIRELQLRRLNGELFWAEISLVRLDPTETAPGYVATVTDITDRKLAREQIEEQLQRISALRTIDSAIAGSLDLRITLTVFLEQTLALLGSAAADILLLNPHTQLLEYAAGRGFRTSALQKTRLRLGEGNAGKAALERQIISIGDLRVPSNSFARSPLLKDENFISYHAVPLIAKGQVKGVLEVFHRKGIYADQDWMDFLETLAGQAAIAIDNATLFNELQRSNLELALAYDTTLEGWSKTLELRDIETLGHTIRVAEMTVKLARYLGMTEQELVPIRRGALLHDIGKMGIPDSILLKQGPLSPEEWEIMRQHPRMAYELLRPITFLRSAIDIPFCHHERWDGKGYPRGLKEQEIPLSARIFAVVDVWDALLSDRPYRKAWTRELTVEHIRSQAGSHFDSQVAHAFLELNDNASTN